MSYPCGSGLFSCRVVAGDGIAITGSGTATDPYVVVNTQAGEEGTTCVQVEACIDAMVPAPLRVTGTPTTGDIAVWDGTAGEWQPTENYLRQSPPTAAENTITPATGVTGLTIALADGHTADAVVVSKGAVNRITYLNEHGELRVIAYADNTVPVRVKGRSAGQTANLTEWTDIANVPLAWVTAAGDIVAPNVGPHRTWVQDTPPASPRPGDIWYDTTGII